MLANPVARDWLIGTHDHRLANRLIGIAFNDRRGERVVRIGGLWAVLRAPQVSDRNPSAADALRPTDLVDQGAPRLSVGAVSVADIEASLPRLRRALVGLT